MKNVCLVNGSLRGKQASSLAFLEDLDLRLPDEEFNKTILMVKTKIKDSYPEEMLKSMAQADAIILIFPLHSYGLPGALMRLLEDYYRYIKAGQEYNQYCKVYLIVNCGFARPEETTGEAVRVVKNFCRRLAYQWRFAICIGTGPVVVATKKIPFLDLKLKRAYVDIISDITGSNSEARDNYLIKPVIPAPILIQIKNYYERKGQMREKSKPGKL